MMQSHSLAVVVFDLDDTLYKEQDFLKSAYQEVAHNLERTYALPCGVYEQMIGWWQRGKNVFEQVIRNYSLPLSVGDLLQMYRHHEPQIILDADTYGLLTSLVTVCVLGMITDGRSLTQRHKIQALGLESFFCPSDILISEETGWQKPAEQPFRQFMDRYPEHIYYYIGDNPAKDFIAPNSLGWTTVCLLDNGCNIHPQDFNQPSGCLPDHRIWHLNELKDII